jgi:hypothetical protein
MSLLDAEQKYLFDKKLWLKNTPNQWPTVHQPMPKFFQFHVKKPVAIVFQSSPNLLVGIVNEERHKGGTMKFPYLTGH